MLASPTRVARRYVGAAPVYAAFPYLSRSQHRGWSPGCDQVQDLIQSLKDGDSRAAQTVARALAKHPRLRGFKGVVIPSPRSRSDRPSLRHFATALVTAGVGERVENAVERREPVESSRLRRRRGLPGILEQTHYDTMSVQHGRIAPEEPVLIVDDLVTTGATLRAAAKRLREAGHTGTILLAAGAYFEPDPQIEGGCTVQFVSRVARFASFPTTKLVEHYDRESKQVVPRTPEGEPPKFVYRAMVLAEYEAGVKTGYLRGRPLYAAGRPVFYSMEPGPSALVAIRYDDKDGWQAKYSSLGEVYAATSQPIPMSKVTLLSQGDKREVMRFKLAVRS